MMNTQNHAEEEATSSSVAADWCPPPFKESQPKPSPAEAKQANRMSCQTDPDVNINVKTSRTSLPAEALAKVGLPSIASAEDSQS